MGTMYTTLSLLSLPLILVLIYIKWIKTATTKPLRWVVTTKIIDQGKGSPKILKWHCLKCNSCQKSIDQNKGQKSIKNVPIIIEKNDWLLPIIKTFSIQFWKYRSTCTKNMELRYLKYLNDKTQFRPYTIFQWTAL